MIKATTGEFDLESIERLDLSGRNIRRIEGLAECINLTELILSGNKISRIEGLEACAKLTRLDLSSNSLGTINAAALMQCPALEYLALQDNRIADVDELADLGRALPRLQALYLRDQDGSRANPICAHPSYATVALQHLRGLATLDGERLALRRSSQAALLDTYGPEDEVEIPPSKPWLGEKWDWDDKFDAPAAVGDGTYDEACAAAKAFVGEVAETIGACGKLTKALASCAGMAAEADALLAKARAPPGDEEAEES